MGASTGEVMKQSRGGHVARRSDRLREDAMRCSRVAAASRIARAKAAKLLLIDYGGSV